MFKLLLILWAVNLALLLCGFVYLRSRIEGLRNKTDIKVVYTDKISSRMMVTKEYWLPVNRILNELLRYLKLTIYYSPSRQIKLDEVLDIRKGKRNV